MCFFTFLHTRVQIELLQAGWRDNTRMIRLCCINCTRPTVYLIQESGATSWSTGIKMNSGTWQGLRVSLTRNCNIHSFPKFHTAPIFAAAVNKTTPSGQIYLNRDGPIKRASVNLVHTTICWKEMVATKAKWRTMCTDNNSGTWWVVDLWDDLWDGTYLHHKEALYSIPTDFSF